MIRKETPNPNNTFIVIESHGVVAAGQSVIMTARPQVEVVKPYKLYIHPLIADKFVITDIRVGNRSMFPCSQNLEASQFSHGDGHEMKVDPVMCSQDFVMVVTNMSGVMSPFRANWACYLPREVPQGFPMSRTRLPAGPLVPWADSDDQQAFDKALEQQAAPQKQVEDVVPGPRTALVPVEAAKRKPALQKQEPPNFGWDPGYGDD